MGNQKLSEVIREFALEQSDGFELDALLAYVRKKQKGFSDEDRLYDLACGSDYLFEDEREVFTDLFYPRHLFFNGAEFLVTPQAEEVEAGVLFPGHRFVPFISREVFPGEAVLKLPNGSSAASGHVEFPSEPAQRALVFYGSYGSMDYLFHDDETNVDRLTEGAGKPLNVTVFDLQDFYAEHKFQVGDSLLLTVEDWLNGVYSVRYISKDNRPVDFAYSNEWMRGLRFGFDESLGESELSHDCYEQMARSLWIADSLVDSPSVLKDPPLTLAAFFRAQKDIKLETIGQVSFFWPKDQPLDSRMMNSMVGSGPEEETELDVMFSQLGLSVDTQETEAYMRDALARGEREFVKTLGRVIQGRTLWFSTAEEQRMFDQLFQELWEDVRKRYNPETDTQRETRAVFLELNDHCLKILRELDQNGNDPVEIMNHPATLQLGELSGMIHSVLVLFNQDAGDAVGEINMPLDEMAHQLSQAIDGLSVDLRNVGRMEQDTVGPVYQLKISLNKASPPIWRRVLVPAGIQLETLHTVIQAVFGWTDSHLHQFIDGRTHYEPNPEGSGWGMMEIEDSRGVRLQDLMRREKDKIIYEYDFGDSWEHVVLLEKVMEPEPDQQLPICVKGMRACPPEDCGGLYGYYSMLEILEGPACQEKKELTQWLGGPLDPKAFNCAEANARLRAWLSGNQYSSDF